MCKFVTSIIWFYTQIRPNHRVRMDFGFYGFQIHNVHNPWIFNGFGMAYHNPSSIIHMDYGFLIKSRNFKVRRSY